MATMTGILGIVELIFVATLVISVVFGITTIIWAIAKWSERSATRDLMKHLRESQDAAHKTFNVSEEWLQELIVNASQVPSTQAKIPSTPNRHGILSKGQESLLESGRTGTTNYSIDRQSLDKAQTLFKAGHMSLRYGDFSSAIREYTDAITIAPRFAEAYNARGMAYRKLTDLQNALSDYTSALHLNPQLAAAYNNRGVVHMEVRQFELALSDFDNAISLEPNNAYGYCNRAIIHNNMGHFDKSVADSSQAIEMDPNLAEAYVTRGIARLYFQSDTAARQDFKNAESLGYNRSEIKNKLNSFLGD